MFEPPDARAVIAAALAEDLGVPAHMFTEGPDPGPELLLHDLTTAGVIGLDARFAGHVVAREECVVAGLPVLAAVFELLSERSGVFEPVDVFPLVAEGARVASGTAVAEVDGLAAVVLAGERTALNLLMFLSGIATRTARWVDVAGTVLAVCDTRKTMPGLRTLSKYAVRVGGGVNHRTGLYDMVLVKDNHLRGLSIPEAIERARSAHPSVLVEVEADTAEQAVEAVSAGADLVLLDNFDDKDLPGVVAACRTAAASRGRAVSLEVSGGVTFERLSAIRDSGVDRVSTSAITLAPPVDFGLDER